MAPVLVPLRPSSEHILIVRAPGAREQHGCHSILFIVGALRARRTVCLLLRIILRPRVARAQKIIRLHSLLCSASKKDNLAAPRLLADFFSILLLLCTADASIIPSMRHTWALIGLLAGLCLIGANTTQLIPAATEAGRIGWMLYLIAFPIALAGLVRIGWTWTAMACVIYGTVGLALDLATVTSILGGQGAIGALFFFSAMSGIVNFLLILFGGRAFLHSSLGAGLPESRPPSPPSPSSSARP